MKSLKLYTSPCGTYRILEILDECHTLEDLEGDTFSPECNPDIPREKILAEQEAFRECVESEGVFGYVLEHWDPKPDAGWTHVDSCWGFVGRFDATDENRNHYIVEELKRQIPSYRHEIGESPDHGGAIRGGRE